MHALPSEAVASVAAPPMEVRGDGTKLVRRSVTHGCLAVKLLHDDLDEAHVADFRREMAVMRSLNHPNVVRETLGVSILNHTCACDVDRSDWSWLIPRYRVGLQEALVASGVSDVDRARSAEYLTLLSFDRHTSDPGDLEKILQTGLLYSSGQQTANLHYLLGDVLAAQNDLWAVQQNST